MPPTIYATDDAALAADASLDLFADIGWSAPELSRYFGDVDLGTLVPLRSDFVSRCIVPGAARLQLLA